MSRKIKKFLVILLILATILLPLSGCSEFLDSITLENTKNDESETYTIEENNYYYDLEDVVEYIKKYNKLPPNYITKKEAREMGWDPKKGNLWDVTDQYVIGGDKFGNFEKKLPEKNNRYYYECDINYSGGHRGPERLVFSNDGLIYLTLDHYKTFELLYGVE